MRDEPIGKRDPELTASLAELEYCSTKIEGALSAVNACVKSRPADGTTTDDLVAVCDRLKQYVSDFWDAYNDALRLLNRPTEEDILAALLSIERNCG